MKVAIPIWNGSVSSVFDFAHKLLLLDIENGREINRLEISLSPESVPQRAGRLKDLGVNVLVCGAISQALANMVTASGIQVLPYVTGRFDDILQAYLTGQLILPQFTMPGYWTGARRGFGRRRRGCRWRSGR